MGREAPLDLKRVIFTEHAIARLKERMHRLNGICPKNPKKTARRMLLHAHEEHLDPVIELSRAISNNKEVRYFTNSGWRFIIYEANGEFFVLTIERVYR